MTLHWWMHWFWITLVVPLLLAARLSAGAPSLLPEDLDPPEDMLPGTLLVPHHESLPPPRFHHDSSLYGALVHGVSPFPADLAEGSPPPLLPFLMPVTLIHHPSTPQQEQEEEEEEVHHPTPQSVELVPDTNATTLAASEDGAMDHEMLADEGPDDVDGQTKMVARGISLSSRNGKAIGRDFVPPSTPMPQVVASPIAEISNHNPFLHAEESSEEEHLPRREDVHLLPATEPPSPPPPPEELEEVTSEKHEPSSEPPPAPEEQTPAATSPEPPKPTEQQTSAQPLVPETLPTVAPPAWVPSFSSEEESAEEAEAEANARPNGSLADVEEPPMEPEEEEASSESVVKGLMTAEQGLDASSIAGIVIGLVGLVSLVGGAVGFVLYRRRYLNKPQTLNDKCSNADSSGYIDDTLRVSASRMNSAGTGATTARNGGSAGRGGGSSRPRAPGQDNSEEMYSLDNDSFLNSLEAMTIQNYWTDSVKHTKL